MTDRPKYEVSTFGEFSIKYNNKQINEFSNRSKKPWNFLEYLIMNRNRTVPQNEVIELLWGDDDSDNPQGALKVLLHRVRKSLEELGKECPGDIVLKRGEYSWKPETDTVFDFEIFTALCEKADNNDLSSEERLKLYLEAISLYKGDYLLKNGESWVIPLRNDLHKRYLSAVYGAIELLKEKQSYNEIVPLCRKAIKIECLDEKLYFNLVQALYRSGSQEEALKEYSFATDMFYKKFGITPTTEILDLYKVISNSTKRLETDINIIKQQLAEQGEAIGAFFCEYSFFKDIYRLMARTCSRSGDSIFLCLLTLESDSGTDNMDVKTRNKAMEDLEETLKTSLRRGDVVSRYSVSQFVMMLPTASYEDVEAAMKRVLASFGRKHLKKDASLNYKLQALDPKEVKYGFV